MKKILFIFFLIITLLLALQSNTYAEEKVVIYLDKESAGWAYKVSDYAFVIEKEGCSIQWNAVEEKDGGKYLSVRRNCKVKFMEQIKLHRSILIEINKKWPLTSFKYILWGPFCDRGDWKWCKPIAQASLKSPDYNDYWKNYPNSKLKEVNSLFVRLANSSKSYASFSNLLSEFNVDVELISVEKVFSERLNKSPFLNEFKQIVPNSNPRVMYNVGMATFYIIE